MSNKEINIFHFTGGDAETGALAGVERTMVTKAGILNRLGYDTRFVVGARPLDNGTVIEPELNSGYFPTWESGDIDIEPQNLEAMRNVLLKYASAIGVFENSTNAPRHNPPFGVVAAEQVDASVRGERAPAVIWSHDSRGLSHPGQFQKLLPSENGGKVVFVSPTRLEEFVNLRNQLKRDYPGMMIPDHDLHVVPNPIGPDYFEFYKHGNGIPADLKDLAPNIGDAEIPGNESAAHNVYFGKSDEYRRIVLPARIVEQKGILPAIDVMVQASQIDNETPWALVITGPCDVRKPVNQKYWEAVRTKALNLGKNPNLEVVFLMGAKQEYMPYIYDTAEAIFTPFKNEGFSLTNVEAALCGTASISSSDRAILNTTEGNVRQLDLETWTLQPHVVAKDMVRYLRSGRKDRDIKALQQIALNKYSPDIVGKKLQEVLEI